MAAAYVGTLLFPLRHTGRRLGSSTLLHRTCQGLTKPQEFGFARSSHWKCLSPPLPHVASSAILLSRCFASDDGQLRRSVSLFLSKKLTLQRDRRLRPSDAPLFSSTASCRQRWPALDCSAYLGSSSISQFQRFSGNGRFSESVAPCRILRRNASFQKRVHGLLSKRLIKGKEKKVTSNHKEDGDLQKGQQPMFSSQRRMEALKSNLKTRRRKLGEDLKQRQEALGEKKDEIVAKTKEAKRSALALWHKYGWVGVSVYTAIYVVCLASFVAATHWGFLTAEQLKQVVKTFHLEGHIDTKSLQQVDSLWGRLLVAWLATKLIEPLRLFAAVSVTPMVARWLRRHQFLKDVASNGAAANAVNKMRSTACKTGRPLKPFPENKSWPPAPPS